MGIQRDKSTHGNNTTAIQKQVSYIYSPVAWLRATSEDNIYHVQVFYQND